MGIAKGLKSAISRSGYTIKSLAEEVGVNPQTLYAIIKRDSNPHLSLCLSIARVLEIEPAELYFDGPRIDAHTLGERLREGRISIGISQRELANITGVSEISIRSYEANKRVPSVEFAYRLCKALGVTVDCLIDGLYEVKEKYANNGNC